MLSKINQTQNDKFFICQTPRGRDKIGTCEELGWGKWGDAGQRV